MDQLRDILKQLGLREKEISLYLAILKHGKITPVDLSKATNINRTTVYSATKSLVEAGIVAEDISGSRLYLVAAPPEDLKNVLQKEERKLEERRSLLVQAIEQIKDVFKTTQYAIPKIRFVVEEDLKDFFFQRVPEWNRSALEVDGLHWGLQEKEFVKYFEDLIDWFWKNSPKEIGVKIISNESFEEHKIRRKGYKGRKIIFWKENVKFSSTIWVMGDYMVMFVISKKPHYLVEIYDKTFAHNMREVIKGIWQDINKGK